MKTAALALTLTLLLAAAGASATTPIYRCGPGGKTYSQTPCAGGTQLEASDSRSAAQQAEAKRVALRERRLAADLARERRLQEAASAPAAATGFNARPLPPDAAASAVQRKKRIRVRHGLAADGKDFVAFVPRGARPK